jgi:thiamine pyrophosphokinase
MHTVFMSHDVCGLKHAVTMATTSSVLAGALGGRLDHTLGNLNALYAYPELPLVLIGEGNVVRLLQRGETQIQPAEAEGKHCGIIPLAGPAIVSSKGLKWDMGALPTCFCPI